MRWDAGIAMRVRIQERLEKDDSDMMASTAC